MVSFQTMRELLREMSDRFEDIVEKKISTMERHITKRLTRVEATVALLVDARRQVTIQIQLFHCHVTWFVLACNLLTGM